ncbi:MAG: DUF1573 domain-containing protein [bacterium]
MRKNQIPATSLSALLMSLFILAVLSLSYILYPAYALAGPQITFPETSFDFGEIYQNKKVNHIFSFKNIGDQVLNINGVKTSCGCTAAVLSSKTINPGESGQIEITFNSAYRKDKQKKVIYVHSDDQAHPVSQLTIEAMVRVDLEASPPNAYFRQVKAGEVATQEVVLKNTGKDTMSILSINTAPSSAISVKAAKEDSKLPFGLKQNESLAIIVSAKAQKDSTRVNGQVIIKTDSKTTPEVIIPVFLSSAEASTTN